MRADVGKIMITPKGDYDAATQYERLDIVRDRNNVYLSKDSVKNVSPESDHNKWMKLVDGIMPNAIAQASAIYDSVDYAQVVHATGAAENSPTDLNSKIEPVQDFNGYDAPWPGGGGKNLYDSVTYPLTPGFINYRTGALQSQTSETYVCTQAFVPCEQLRGQTITISPEPGGANPGAAFYSADNESAFISGGKGTALLVPDTASFLRFSVAVGSENIAMIEIGDTQTTYAPYENVCPIQGWTGVTIDVSETSTFTEKKSYNVSLPTDAGTVYGGVLTVNMDGSATLAVDRLKLDLGELSYKKASSGLNYYADIDSPIVLPSNSDTMPNMLCDVLPIAPPKAVTTNPVDYGITLHYTYNRLHVRYVSAGSASQLKTALTGYIAVVMLVEPIVYTFPADSILLDYGENYVKSNTGDVSIKYVLDTKTYIDNKIAALMNA